MNNRIKELAFGAANKIADQFTPGFFDDRMVSDIAAIQAKFAELIVRDVVGTVKRTQITSPDFEWVMLNNYDFEVEE